MSTRIVLDAVLLVVLAAVTVTDLRSRRIPNRITGPAALLAIVIGLIGHPGGVGDQLAAGAAAFGFMFVFALINPKGLGMGDVKLAAVLGLYLGASVAVALLAGFLASAAAGLVVIARLGLRRGRKVYLPLGPFLAAGGVLAAVAGPQLLQLWIPHLGPA